MTSMHEVLSHTFFFVDLILPRSMRNNTITKNLLTVREYNLKPNFKWVMNSK